MSPGARVALYWVPARDDPLWALGNHWLGYDPELACCIPQPHPGMEEFTAAPRLYGFHATLRPPIRLATDWAAFLGAAEMLAAKTAAFALPSLAVANLDGFLALRETRPCPALHALSDACIRATNTHRLPPDAAETARRRAANLTATQESLLATWGYPYVMECWRFHLTLSRRLSHAEMAIWQPHADRHFGAALHLPRQVSDLAIFTQHSLGAPFRLADRLALKGRL